MEVNFTVVEGPHEGIVFSFREHDHFIVGRGDEAHFCLPEKDQFVSRHHFLVEVNPPLCRIMDLGSRNGTFVNHARVVSTNLKHGDLIRGGQTVFRVAIDMGSDVADEETIVARNPPPGVTTGPHVAADSTVRMALPELCLDSALLAASSAPSCAVDISGEQTAVQSTPRSPTSPPAAETKKVQDTILINEPGAKTTPPKAPLSAVTRKLLPEDYEARSSRRLQLFPGYRIIDELGRGGMGVVYLALRDADESVVALKAIAPAVTGTQADVERFLREAGILRELMHPHIVAFREMGAAHGQLFFAMDYVPGTTAQKLLASAGAPLAVNRAVKLISQLLEALEYAYSKGIVHRDIKPANLLITEQDEREFLKLSDFGLARTYLGSRLSGLTLLGDVGGTTAYMAPEQITNFRGSQHYVDQYSAAATLYYLLTMKYVYDFPTEVSKQFAMILSQPAVPIATRRPELPAGLCEIIHRSLSRTPTDRFTDPGAMRRALLPYL